jgi:hypothetical protein
MPLRWQTSIETPAGFWEIPAEALAHTTCWGFLKQPDKQEVTKDLMSSLANTFNEPPFNALKGTITQTNNCAGERKETCKADRYTVELLWKGLGPGNWVDMKMGTNTLMTFVMVPASSGEILINGKKAPGTWFPTGGGLGPGAYLTVNETWRR